MILMNEHEFIGYPMNGYGETSRDESVYEINNSFYQWMRTNINSQTTRC